MYIAISKRQEFFEIVKEESLKAGEKYLKLSIIIFIHLKEYLIQFLMSYTEYSPLNIRERGLKEIFFQRALRFFSLEIESTTQNKKKVRKQKITIKSIVIRGTKLIVFPIYILILLMLKRKGGKNKKKVVRNVYTE